MGFTYFSFGPGVGIFGKYVWSFVHAVSIVCHKVWGCASMQSLHSWRPQSVGQTVRVLAVLQSTKCVCVYLSEFWQSRYLEAPRLVVGQVKVESVELVRRHYIDQPLHRRHVAVEVSRHVHVQT